MRIMFIGPSGAGKTTLSYALSGGGGKASKTQMIGFAGDFIDTPGEYLEIPRFYKALFVTAQQADIVIMVIPADKCGVYLPDGIAQSFPRPVVGVVNKIDLVGANLSWAEAVLEKVGVKKPYYAVSARTGEGLSSLKLYIRSLGHKSI